MDSDLVALYQKAKAGNLTTLYDFAHRYIKLLLAVIDDEESKDSNNEEPKDTKYELIWYNKTNKFQTNQRLSIIQHGKTLLHGEVSSELSLDVLKVKLADALRLEIQSVSRRIAVAFVDTKQQNLQCDIVEVAADGKTTSLLDHPMDFDRDIWRITSVLSGCLKSEKGSL